MSMRFIFVLSVLSFLNPIATFAAENDSADCARFIAKAKEKKTEQATKTFVSAPVNNSGTKQTNGIH